ncbi:MAG: Wzz/FepE/Etk N-terminal domain-containing protein [Caulobacterales bacterium]
MSGGNGGKARFNWGATPKLGVADVISILWAERFVALAVGAGMACAAIMIAFMVPKSYEARAELLVRLGPEYVYQPATGAAGAGASPDMESVVNAEIQLLRSPEVARRTIEDIGVTRLYPDLRGAPAARREQMALKAFADAFSAQTSPRTPTVALSFAHKHSDMSARVLNTLVDKYLAYRREVLVGDESDALERQAGAFDERAVAASADLALFLLENDIGDFDSELTGTARRAADVDAQLLDARAKRSEAEGRAAALRARYNAEPAETILYSESDARSALVDLQVQREQLLARYQDDAPPVREIDRRISQLNVYLADGDPPSLTRRGINPIRQELAGQLFGMEAEARAQRSREDELTSQKTALLTRLRSLQELEPNYRRLARARTVLQDNAQSLTARAEQSRAVDQLLGRSTDNISVIERAVPPVQGKSLRTPIALSGLLLALLAAFAAAIGRGVMRRAFPTPQSAARTLNAPVLAVTPQASNDRGPARKPLLKVMEGGR